ncbi:alpha/beta fold hydrolase [Cryptosporangium arvum]|uniref:Putative hydrolase or acyltransferase of alpha/beta superfamily n=1 Tax=Cryptosporangium arvum DSM 44712 TaxID=927661 RepID=A0A011AJW8_9ACTN|nr:alpha/beta hydrolase [Cryptosporangium arvum]EXG82256.1 putative hydrolase or acyltransferase of alpha/beta superfamily [Cryptosporangium arvum DSM 44712]
MLEHHRPSPSRRARRSIVAVAVAALLATAFASPAAAQSPGPKSKPTIVLVHGAWADGASWARVTERLQAQGYPVLAVPNPLRGLSSDAAYLGAFLKDHTSGPVVLVGHSYGGAVITSAAASDPDVEALVYVNAFVPDRGESLLGLLSSEGPVDTSIFEAVAYPGGSGDVDLYVKASVFPSAFANDLSPATAKQLAAAQRPITRSALGEQAGAPAWKSLPSWYLLGTADHIISPSLQEKMAERAKSKITKVNASHLSMISQPRAVEAVITAAARSVR